MPQWWRPDRFAARRERLMRRGRILASVRGFFAARGFVEVETPALQVSPGLEPHLRAFATDFHDPDRAGPARRYLHTSPEYAMKKLLVAGMPRIWQLAHVFRDGERGPAHNPEFSMLEWYHAGLSWRELAEECRALIAACQEAAGALTLSWRGRAADARAAWHWLSVAEAFQNFCDINILETAPDPFSPRLDLLSSEAARIGVAPRPGDDWEALYFRIFLERIEPHLGQGAPTILYDYPLAMAALARRSPDDPRVAERFEVYAGGLELANGFGELTDPQEQRARFEADRARRQVLYGESAPIDEDFLAALAHGMPQASGIALGFDRLVMLATGAADIEDVLWAPVC